jgi:SAM-dependent methyltransferase
MEQITMELIHKRYKYGGNSIIPLRKGQRKARKDILRKIAQNEYAFSYRNCTCGSEAFQLLSERDAYGLPCNVVICRQCGLIQVSPCLNEQNLNEFYRDYYDVLYGTKSNHDSLYKDMYQRGKSLAEYIMRNCPNLDADKCRVLEIGCSVGGILGAFAHLGFTVQGVDLEKEAVDYAVEKNLSVTYGSSREIDAKNKYDIIILSHVMEHFYNIEYELSILLNLLEDGGVIYIEVPGLYSSLGNRQFDFLDFIEVDHLFYFSLDTLVNVMRQYGFSLEAGDELPGMSIRSIFKKEEVPHIKEGIKDGKNNLYEVTVDRIINLEKQFQRRRYRHYVYRLLKAMPLSLKLKIKSFMNTR